ncbi:MAG TPA: DNA polymerase III subunit alpha, partial [Bacteroidia bacterium]|nr:DNA polymerase III subunit alpha [Bacteroidia bacterium]
MYLNCHTYYSFKYGTLSVAQLLSQAQQFQIDALVLTDINNTSGCLEFIRESKKHNIRPIVGIDFRKGAKQHYIGIAKNNEGFLELNQHLSACLSDQSVLCTQAPIFYNSYVIYPFGSINPKQLKEHEYIGVKPGDLNKLIFSECRSYLHKLVVLHPVTFSNKKDFNAHRLLRAIYNNTLLSKLPLTEQTNEQELFQEEKKLLLLYEQYPQVVINTRRIIDSCGIQMEFGTSKNKSTFTGSIAEDEALMREKCYEGLLYRYSNPDRSIYERLEKELQAIFNMQFTSYFLINWDMLAYARSKGYFYVGRGSGANSLAAYCLKITDVDPIDLDLYFERFINPYRTNPPDFDIDFSWKDRDDITQYLFEKYGTAHTALLATYNTFQYNSVIRELGKVFGLPKGEIDELVETKQSKLTPDSITHLIFKYSAHIQDFPSHLSIHAGGILISENPINYYTATSMPPKGYPLTQFSMLEAEDVGLYKFDILSQRGLGHIKDTIEVVKKNKGIDIDIHQIAAFKEDEKIKTLLRSGKTMGCFYVESPAMRMLLKKLETDTYLGLVAASSIIRPGVAQSGMMREYILRHRDPKRRNYVHEKLGELMSETYGIMVYQEDVIKVAHYFAGLSLAQADVMRRGMSGKFRAREEFQKAKEDFFNNCIERGYGEETTKEVWRQIESFAGYSFSKGHSASYAVESYQSLYLKAYHPKEFMVGVINNFGGFYRTEQYIHEAKMSGASILPPCINRSEQLTSIQNDDIYLGFIHLGELEKNTTEVLLLEREKNGPFLHLEDFMKRVSISVEQLRILIRMGAFRFTGKTKKELLWEIHHILGNQKKTNPAHELFEIQKRAFKLPELHQHVYDDALDELEILGFPLCSPFDLLKEKPTTHLNVQHLLQHVGEQVSIVGSYVVHKVTRTSNGDSMAFGTFLDVNGYFFDTTHFPKVFDEFPFTGKGCYKLEG